MDLSDATVGQLLIPVTNLERAIGFYRDTLGITFLFAAPPQMSFFMAGNVRLLVGVSESPRPQSSMVYFKVSDIHGVYQTLVERGVPFGKAPHLVHRAATSELWLTEFKDPDGNDLALMGEIPIKG
jgi:methylmalonyl-CoA/ethylmalonyl-CoA epimerase